jgi:hypothetical protein
LDSGLVVNCHFSADNHTVSRLQLRKVKWKAVPWEKAWQVCLRAVAWLEGYCISAGARCAYYAKVMHARNNDLLVLVV